MNGPTGLHGYLKAETASSHEETDRLFGMIGFDTTARYALFLSVQHAALTEIESGLLPYAESLRIHGLQTMPRAAALRADLAALGHSPLPEKEISIFSSLDEAAGAAYVLEGSRLGGRMLSRMIRETMPDAPLAFLDCPAEPGFWQAYTERLNRFTVETTCWPVVLSGADRAFGIFKAKAQAAITNIEAA